MQQAAQQFVGTHDFAAVRSVGTDGQVHRAHGATTSSVEREGDLISLSRVRQRLPLQHGARHGRARCVYAAEGKVPARGDREHSGAAATARPPGRRSRPGGLYMTQLWYDDGKAVFHVG